MATVTPVSNFGGGAGTPWYLIDTSRVIRPIVWQLRENYEFTSMDRSSDPHVFMNNRFLYGVRARMNVGFGLWQLAYASKQTLDAGNYKTARAAMQELRTDGGRMLGIRPTLLLVPPSLEEAGLQIVNAQNDAAGASNVWHKTVELIVAPQLAV